MGDLIYLHLFWRGGRAFDPSQITRHFFNLSDRPIEHFGNFPKVARSLKLGAKSSQIVTGPDLIHTLSTIRNIAGDFGFLILSHVFAFPDR